ncbi:MAG: hypothetical protein LUG50_07340 [Planctomycetaceae bacterium]|nr:hypothetical protein [Planctomycetaceae bacterium]
MPNHVRNILQFSGAEDDITRLFDHIRSEDSTFDFNTLIPMPKTLDIESGSRTTLGMEAAEYRATGAISRGFSCLRNEHQRTWPSLTLDQCIDRLVELGFCDLNLGEVALDNIRDHGAATWYEWCCNNWGTKWNAYSIETGDDTITFETAWNAPVPVIDKLAALFPSVQITHHWADEDMGSNCGHAVYQNGEKNKTPIIDHTSEAYEKYVFCWGESACVEQDANGLWRSKDCENCDGCGYGGQR